MGTLKIRHMVETFKVRFIIRTSERCTSWLLRLKPEKRKVVHVTRKKDP